MLPIVILTIIITVLNKGIFDSLNGVYSNTKDNINTNKMVIIREKN